MLRKVLMAAQPWLTEMPSVTEGKGIIAAFNAQNDLASILLAHGYKPMGQNRYLSPHSSTGTPGIVILDGSKGQRIYSHHPSDPLFREGGHDALSAVTVLEYGGDPKAAFAAATKQLDMTFNRGNRAQSNEHKDQPVVAESTVEDLWDARLPLPELYPPVPALPPNLIPNPLRPWLVDIAERASLPFEFVACPALVALSAVVGRKVGICPKRRDDWVVVPNLWGGIVGKPGVMKSAAISESTKPLKALSKRARERYKLAAEKAEAERVRLELEIAALKENEKRAAKGRYKSE